MARQHIAFLGEQRIGASRWIDRVGVVEVDLHDRFRRGCSRAVYLATKDFEFESREVDAIVLARKEYVANRTLQAVTAGKFFSSNSSGPRQHFRIDRTAKNLQGAL